MSGRRLITSDHHLGHNNIYRFTDADGQRLRPWAGGAVEGDEMMIEAWNSVVKANDTVLHLGDVAISRKKLALLDRMNGRKILIKGNHDIFKLKDYLPYFADIRGSVKQDRLILSHYPIHPESIPPWCHGNVHGHIHEKTVMRTDPDGTRIPDPRYLNACVEVLGIHPVPVSEISEIMAQRHAAAAAG